MDILTIIKMLFTPETIAKALKVFPKIETPVMDIIFPNRPQKTSPVLTVEEVFEVNQTAPVIQRGGAPVAMQSEKTVLSTIEPLQIRPTLQISAVDLNNLKYLKQTDREQWMLEKTEMLRRIVRRTIEGIAATSLTGKISWPLRLEGGGWSTYEIDFTANGENPIGEYTPALLWSNNTAKIKTIFNDLIGMRKILKRNGYGGQCVIWAGEEAFTAIAGVVENYVSTAEKRDLRAEYSGEFIQIGTFKIELRSEEYQNPQTSIYVPIIPSKSIVMFTPSANNRLFYCALDDLDADLQALPMFIKPMRVNDMISLVASSKPLPVPVTKSFVWAEVA